MRQAQGPWVPAFAGMTYSEKGRADRPENKRPEDDAPGPLPIRRGGDAAGVDHSSLKPVSFRNEPSTSSHTATWSRM